MKVLVIFLLINLPNILCAINNGDSPIELSPNVTKLITEHLRLINLKLNPLDASYEDQNELNSTMIRMKDILNVFNIDNLINNWNNFKDKDISSNCSKDISDYFIALHKNMLWAVKSKFQHL